MRKSVTAMLLVVVVLLSVHYAAAEELDLAKMSTRELEKLRERINVELRDRPPVVETKSEIERRKAIREKYDAWLSVYDFDSILADINSGNHGMTDQCAEEISINAGFASDILEDCNYETDPFTDEFRITHRPLKEFGNKCQVFPYIDKNGFKLIVGFPYSNAFHYSQIFLKCGEDIYEHKQFDKKNGFDLQFERINGKNWEYSILSDPFLGDHSLEAVSFREDGSVRKENYQLTDDEQLATNALDALCSIKRKISSRISHWETLGD